MIHENIVMPRTGVTITTYLNENNAVEPGRKRPLVLICPGGGYLHRVPREGEPVAMRLMADGIQAVIVHYSCQPAVWPTALNEIGEAMAYCRAHAQEWNADPEKMAIMGFSAGGHAAASLGTCWHTLEYGESCRPNAMILSYPVITSGEYRHNNSFVRLLGDQYEEKLAEVSLENRVSDKTPPAFLWHTWEDQVVPVENSLMMAWALRRNGIPCEMHIYQKGPHGTALSNNETHEGDLRRVLPHCQNWIEMAIRWLKELNTSEK